MNPTIVVVCVLKILLEKAGGSSRGIGLRLAAFEACELSGTLRTLLFSRLPLLAVLLRSRSYSSLPLARSDSSFGWF